MIDGFSTNGSKWSGYSYFIFVPDYTYEGKIMKPEDFVKIVKIKCYGCANKPGLPFLYKCREKGIIYDIHREQNEIFNSFEECLAEYSEGFQEKWIKLTYENLVNHINICKQQKENYDRDIKEKQTLLDRFNFQIGKSITTNDTTPFPGINIAR